MGTPLDLHHESLLACVQSGDAAPGTRTPQAFWRAQIASILNYGFARPLWVMCGRLRFGKVYCGCKRVECCYVSGLLMRRGVPLALMESAWAGSNH
jgi:hypothetical protein